MPAQTTEPTTTLPTIEYARIAGKGFGKHEGEWWLLDENGNPATRAGEVVDEFASLLWERDAMRDALGLCRIVIERNCLGSEDDVARYLARVLRPYSDVTTLDETAAATVPDADTDAEAEALVLDYGDAVDAYARNANADTFLAMQRAHQRLAFRLTGIAATPSPTPEAPADAR